MGTKFTYALVLTICQAVLSLLLYFTGFQTEKLAAGQHAGWISLAIMVVVLWLGIKAVREESPDKSLSYGQGFGAGLVISLLSAVMSAVYTFIHFKFVNPSFYDYQLEMTRAQWVKAGMSDARMEQAEAFMRKYFMTPTASAIFTVIIVVVCGLVVSLILAAILKRAKPDGVPPLAA